jgi:iron complex outermembrane recepter protein
MQLKPLNQAIALAIVGGAFAAPYALAQETQRVEITGSAIKRIAAEGALPVITLTKEDIEKSGATTARELIQALPSMQGFTTASDSVNGGGGGLTTASIHNVGEIYTLVLLNGRRIAPFTSGSVVNLDQLPLSSVSRVEVLTDGASALYGADAIAGVVNFITLKDSTEGSIDLRADIPQHAGGKEYSASIGKGFGDLATDGFNIYGALSFGKAQKITAAQRKFSSTGVFPFRDKGVDYWFIQTSINSNPPNIFLDGNVKDQVPVAAGFNPTLLAQGNCGDDPGSKIEDPFCTFDYASTIEAQPESEDKNLYLSGQVKLGQNFTFFGEALLSDASITASFAPPAQPLSAEIDGTLYNRYVAPYLGTLGVNPAGIEFFSYNMRLRDAGLRTDEFRTKAQHIVLGVEGTVGTIDVSGSYTHSQNKQTDTFLSGFSSRTKLEALIDSGAFDPWQQGTDESRAALAPAVFRGYEMTSVKSKLDTLSFKGSMPIFEAPGGPSYLAVGADFSKQNYALDPSPLAFGATSLCDATKLSPEDFALCSDFPVGGVNGSLPFDTSRKVKGVYSELVLPLSKQIEFTGAARYDSYDAAQNDRNFDALGNAADPVQQGNKYSKATYKLGVRFQPMPEVLIRGAVGTGFRAPTLQDIADPLKEFGVIAVQRDCPVGPGDPLFPGCRSVATQYKLQTGGNPFTGDAGLKPENSDQWTLGFRVEPNSSFTGGLDLWSVKIKDAITVVPEDTAFDNFETYRGLFSVTTDTSTNRPILTFSQVPVNAAVRRMLGIDWDVTLRNKFSFGNFTTRFTGTHLLESYFDLGFGTGQESSLGKLGSDDLVAFRYIATLANTLSTGPLENTLTINYRSGYKDQTYAEGDGTIFFRNTDGSVGAEVPVFGGLDIPSYITFDYQGKYDFNKALSLTFGIKNLFDKDPPLSLKSVAGNQLGYDPRYADGTGRTFYLQGKYAF